MKFDGYVVGETKVRKPDGMAVRITIDGGLFVEISNIESDEIFKKLCNLADLGKHLEITIYEKLHGVKSVSSS